MSRPEDVVFRARAATMAVVRVLLVLAFLVALLILPALLIGDGWATVIGMVLCTIGVVALMTAKPMALYPAHTFGIEYRVDEDTFDGPTERCSECGALTAQGLKRRFARQYVALGVPVHTLEWGINHYCLDCADPGGVPGLDPDSEVGRVRTTDAERELERAFD